MEKILYHAHWVEKQQLGPLAYSADDLRVIYSSEGSFCLIIFDNTSNATVIGHSACKVITSSFGEKALQSVSTCITPAHMGKGYGRALDNRSEIEAVSRGLKWRVARSWVGSDIYRQVTGIDMGSPFNSANRFRIKQGFLPMSIEQAESWFSNQAIRYHHTSLEIDGQHFCNVPIAEMEPSLDGQPILLIFMIKKIGK